MGRRVHAVIVVLRALPVVLRMRMEQIEVSVDMGERVTRCGMV